MHEFEAIFLLIPYKFFKIQAKKDQISEAEKELKKAKSDLKNLKTVVAKKY
jgi:hypothetical protein